MAEVCDIKFSNDGKSMLLTTTSNNIYVLDAYGGEKVSASKLFHLRFISSKFPTVCCVYLDSVLKVRSLCLMCQSFCKTGSENL